MSARKKYKKRRPPIDGLALKWQIIGVSALALAVAGLGVWGARFVGKRREDSVAKRVFDPGDPASFASDFQDAIYGIGTNEDLIFQTIESIPTQAFYLRVMSAYKALTGSRLNIDLKEDLSIEDLEKFEQIKNSKPLR